MTIIRALNAPLDRARTLTRLDALRREWLKPNRNGFDWMLTEVWPIMRRSLPDAVLQVAGPGSPEGSPALRAQGIDAQGFAEHVDRFFAEAALAIVPHRFGGGVRIKAVAAMARACPVVTTTIAAEGLRAAAGVHLAVADGSKMFAKAIVDLLRSPTQAQAMGEAGQLHVGRHFSWQGKIDALVNVLSAISSNARIGQTAA